MEKSLRLYVWDDALCDYTCGIIFALASSLEEARRNVMAGEKENSAHYNPDYVSPSILDVLDREPKVYDEPVVRVVWGGG